MLARSVSAPGSRRQSISYLGKMLVMIAHTAAGIWNLKEKPSQMQENCDVMRFLKITYFFFISPPSLSDGCA